MWLYLAFDLGFVFGHVGRRGITSLSRVTEKWCESIFGGTFPSYTDVSSVFIHSQTLLSEEFFYSHVLFISQIPREAAGAEPHGGALAGGDR
jgi:hypothetical protein